MTKRTSVVSSHDARSTSASKEKWSERASAWIHQSVWVKPMVTALACAAGLTFLSLIGWMGSPTAHARSLETDAGVDAEVIAPSLAPISATASSAPSPIPTGDEPSGHAPSSSRATPDDPVILNAANAEDFRRLPGVGEKRALAIVELRKKLGKFRSVEELRRVKGIGRKSLAKLRPLVRLEPPPLSGK